MSGPNGSGPNGSTSGGVSFRAVTKRYGPVIAVDAVSFDIAPGTLVTLLGPSGCGKTTTLRLIAGLERASEGRIVISGADVTTKSPGERDVSMVFQSYALFPHLNVMDNVCYGLRSSGVARTRAMEQARVTLAQVGLIGLEKRLPSELSGGQQQRVALARAMVLEPRVLLFDEPLSNLDARLRRHVRDEIRTLQQSLGLTVVYVTHDQAEALAISDRIIVMNQARIAQDGTRELYEKPADRFVVNFMGEASILPVEIETAEEDQAAIRIGPVTVRLPHRGLTAGKADLAVRPHAIRLISGDPGPGSLRGVIRRAVYCGDHMEYDVMIENFLDPVFVVDANVADPPSAGETVGIELAVTGLSPGSGGIPMTPDIAARYDFAIELAREAGALASRARQHLGTLEAKLPMDYATQADHDVEAMIRRRVADRFGDAVIGEEDGGVPADLVWVVDPIDGTVNYIHGTARWCVSIGLLLEGQPEIGVIHAPDQGRMFTARRGQGAFLNGAAITVSHLRHGASPVIETGWSPRRPLTAYTALITRLVGDEIEFRRHGSGALGMADVACGLNDGYLELHINAWDVLAGLVLVREAGGWVDAFLDDDGLTRGNPIVACTPEITGRLTQAAAFAGEIISSD